MKIKRFIRLALGTILLLCPALLRAQQDDVVEAARKAQAEKRGAPKAKMTIDNDNLNTLTGTVSVVGQVPEPPPDASKADATAKAGATADKGGVKDEAYWRKQFADANKKLTDDEHELDILQREYNLKQEQFYTDPMASLKQDYSRQDLNDTRQKIDDKTAAVGQDKQAISDLEDALRQAGGDPGWATPPSTPASDQTAPAPATPDTTVTPAGPTPAPAPGAPVTPPSSPMPSPGQ